MKPYEVLLYYKFVELSDPQAVRDEHEQMCRNLGLKGRILIATEGINGTVSGERAATEAYRTWMSGHPFFHGIEFKVDEADAHAFLKLHVRVKRELVNLGLPDAPRNWEKTAPYIEPEEVRELLRNPSDDVVFLDTRSEYEFEVGKFRNAVGLNIRTFRELPQRLEELAHLKNKKIISYCTGGIRCEKITGYLMEQGFENIYQIHGGIIRYGKETGGEGFEGQCYVFDQRLTVPVNTVDPVVVGKCSRCGAPTEHLINCANADCNAHLLMCDDCLQQLEGCCSEPCTASPNRRAYDGRGYYLRGVNSKNYVEPRQRTRPRPTNPAAHENTLPTNRQGTK
jgi:UPF0176 protein